MKVGKKTATKTGLLILSIMLTLGIIGTAQAENKVVKIGVIAQITGPYGPATVGIKEAAMDVISAVNTLDPIPGITLEGVWVDGQSDPAKAMSAAKKMVAQHKPVVALGWTTPSAMALKKFWIDKKIPQVQGGGADPLWELPSWSFSAQAPYVNQVAAWVDYYVEHIWPQKGLKRKPVFAWVTWDNAAGRSSITDKVKEYIRSKGVEIMPGDGEFFPTVPTEVSSQIMRLKQHNVDFTYGMLIFPTAAAILKGLDKMEMIDRIDISAAIPNFPVLVQQMKGLARNVYCQDYPLAPEDWASLSPKIDKIYKENNRQELPAMLYGVGAGWALVATEAVRMAAKAAGPDLTGEDTYKALTQMKNYTRWGIGPPVSFSEKRRIGCDQTYLFRLNDNQVNRIATLKHPNLTKFEF